MKKYRHRLSPHRFVRGGASRTVSSELILRETSAFGVRRSNGGTPEICGDEFLVVRTKLGDVSIEDRQARRQGTARPRPSFEFVQKTGRKGKAFR